MGIIRFLFISFVKICQKIFYPTKVTWVNNRKAVWDNVPLVVVLNHTSLFEFIYAGILPFSYIKKISSHLIAPVAKETSDKWFMGFLFKLMAPKPIPISRKKDESWQYFLDQICARDIMIFLPEGRMKRLNGFDKHGKKMTVRGGIVEVLKRYQGREMMFVYSGGLHHVLPPGKTIPRLFKRLSVKLESIKVSEYLEKFKNDINIKKSICLDMEKRRDKYT
ncbi:MAG: hypothetical protein CMP11_08890 [Zetaproteobacteria bacterium]|nr:hypothetical protein [Pseudobdellovibrionaceae bacterium]|tara:strand:- start:672 stop:1334 length:663 start_codon:yes stop_codon:yes gene_type:complete